MSENSFPVKGERCVNPERCLARYQRMKSKFEGYRTTIEKQYEGFLKQSNWKERIDLSFHAKKRMIERAVGTISLYEVIEHGHLIACEGNSLALMGHTKVGKGTYRVLHVIFRFEQNKMRIITVYDPSYSAYLYDPTLTYRICWCAPHPSDF